MFKYLRQLIFFGIVCLTFQTWADDCSAYRFEDWKYGHIKTSEPNDQIALEKELMVVTHDSIRAIFVFKNTTCEDVEVPCAFPLNVVLPFFHPVHDTVATFNDSIFLGGDNGNCKHNYKLWNIALNKKVTPLSDSEFQFAFSKATLSAANKRLRKYSFDEYETRVQDLTDGSCIPEINILQNGNYVTIENVGIETTVSDKNLAMDIFFHHHIIFEPYETVKVEISYPIASLMSYSAGLPMYNVKYDISSGGTWKDGNIKSFAIYSDFTMECHSNAVYNKKMDVCSFANKHIYYKKNYKPQTNDFFIFKNEWEKEQREYLEKNYATEEGLSVLKNYLQNDSLIVDSYLEFPECRRSPLPFIKDVKTSTNQDASPLFDGDPYTSYVAPKDSWIEFTLTKTVIGPFISNGNVSSTLNETIYRSMLQEKHKDSLIRVPLFQDTVWNNTPRIRTMTLRRNETYTSQVMMLADKYGPLPVKVRGETEETRSNVWENINSVQRPMLLTPGRYRLSFGATYRGKHTKLVGLSEIWFEEPFTNEFIAMLESDKKDSVSIYQNLNALIGKDWVKSREIIPYKYLSSQSSKRYKDCLKKYAENDSKLGKEIKRFKSAIAKEDQLLFRILLISAAAVLLLIGCLLLFARKKKKHT